MSSLELLVDLHRDGFRQGPGSDELTLQALQLCGLAQSGVEDRPLYVADIGCGTGAASMVLAKHLPSASITAVDLFQPFLDVLVQRSEEAGVSHRVQARSASMDALTFQPESLDLIWSEGAIYNIGFQNGLKLWRPFLRPGGTIAVSEITWLHPDPPAEIRDHWLAEYPEIDTAAAKVRHLEEAGFDLRGYFTLPVTAWMDEYYQPLRARHKAFLERHSGGLHSDAAQEVVAADEKEIALYERYNHVVSYGFYVARRR